MNWQPLLNNELLFEVNTQVMPTKGNLVYEYNPFRNYRLSQNMLEYKETIIHRNNQKKNSEQ